MNKLFTETLHALIDAKARGGRRRGDSLSLRVCIFPFFYVSMDPMRGSDHQRSLDIVLDPVKHAYFAVPPGTV